MGKHFTAQIVEDPTKPKERDDIIRVICMSDSHGFHKDIPKSQIHEADLLLFAGDCSLWGNPVDIKGAKEFIESIPAKHRVVISGNLDLCFDSERIDCFLPFIDQFGINHDDFKIAKKEFLENAKFTYLEHESYEVLGLKIFGSPYTPTFGDFAFQTTSETAPQIWSKVPEDTDIVICHGPPQGACDRTNAGINAGCPELRKAIERVQPALMVFGHIHEGHGHSKIGDTLCCNVALVNSQRVITNPPTYIDLIPIQ